MTNDSKVTKYVCENCGLLWNESELHDIDNLLTRVAPGEVIPYGQCPAPDCGALCHSTVKLPGTHTPGPWQYDGDKEIREGKTHIATIGYAYTSDGEPQANARLIAAAPELLAALKAILDGQLTGQVDTNAVRFQDARFAISKAEGRDE